MQFSEVLKTRRSVRTFEPKPVGDEELEYLLDAAASAPSACNHQPTAFVVVRDPERLAAIGRPNTTDDGKWINRWLAKAPVIAVVCGDRGATAPHHGVDFWQIDAAIAAEHLVLAATDVGLGSCWVGAFDEPAVRSTLGIPEHVGILALIALGYPAVRMAPAERMTRAFTRADAPRPGSRIAHWDTW